VNGFNLHLCIQLDNKKPKRLFFIEAPIVQFDTKSVRTAGGQMTCFVLI